MYDGGAGTDVLAYDASPLAVTMSLDGAANDGTPGETDNVLEVENLDGSAYGDTLTGDGGANQLKGLGGDDVIDGGPGTDLLDGGDGRDTLQVSSAKEDDGCEADSDDAVVNCARLSIA
ncbi:hypothetical protein AB0368_04875 [Actinoplanes sp. NPDC051475]|uniref:hypothetical protein n=1 Tax=Actinoplanes sp. NPDC051475 TaxID=3157225 RepID=UPI00344D3865